MNTQTTNENPLGSQPVKKLLMQFAIPSIVAMLVSSLYNIVDQFFIGRNVGELGNAATNISFPLSISCIAIALLFGIGGASAFNLAMGKGEKEKAVYYIGNSAVMLFGCGVILTTITLLFLEPLLHFFGSPDNVLSYAKTYTGIVAIGFPFLILTTGSGHLIRADGRPKISMICNLTGAVINTILDALFVSVLQMGMAGAAIATVIGQVIFIPLQDCNDKKRTSPHQQTDHSESFIPWYCSLQQPACHDDRTDHYEQISQILWLPFHLWRSNPYRLCRNYHKSKSGISISDYRYITRLTANHQL